MKGKALRKHSLHEKTAASKHREHHIHHISLRNFNNTIAIITASLEIRYCMGERLNPGPLKPFPAGSLNQALLWQSTQSTGLGAVQRSAGSKHHRHHCSVLLMDKLNLIH